MLMPDGERSRIISSLKYYYSFYYVFLEIPSSRGFIDGVDIEHVHMSGKHVCDFGAWIDGLND